MCQNSGPVPEGNVTVLHFADLFINLQTPKLRILTPLGIHLSQSHKIHFFSDIKKIVTVTMTVIKTLILSTQTHFIVQTDQVLLEQLKF